jgi:hypothetical protein
MRIIIERVSEEWGSPYLARSVETKDKKEYLRFLSCPTEYAGFHLKDAEYYHKEQCSEVVFNAVSWSKTRKEIIATGSEGFYGLPHGLEKRQTSGGNGVTAGETAPTHTINTNHAVAVATDTYWLPIDKDTPRNVKLQLLSIGGVAQYGTLSGDVSFYTHWCPVPKKPK